MINLLKRAVIQLNSRNKLYLLGDGRSGTTWLAQILNFDGRYIEFFEPYHGRHHLKLSDDRLYPTVNDISQLEINVNQLDQLVYQTHNFAGMRRMQKLPPPIAGSLIKDISSHLILGLLSKQNSKRILILRNPISVATSKEKYGRWHSEADIQSFLEASPILNKISRGCFSDGLISSVFFEYIMMWCLIYRYTLSCASNLDFQLVFYENLVRNPKESIRHLFLEIGQEKCFNKNQSKILSAVNKSSRTVSKSSDFQTNKHEDQPWKGKKTHQDIENAYKILKRFDLYQIYENTIESKVNIAQLKSMAEDWE